MNQYIMEGGTDQSVIMVAQPNLLCVLRKQGTLRFLSPAQVLLAATEGQHIRGALGVVFSGEGNNAMQPCCWAGTPSRGIGP